MQILDPYIPREHLALRINYCKKRLAELPEVTMTQRTIRGIKKDVLMAGNHTFSVDSLSADRLRSYMKEREKLLCDLAKYEGLWNSSFRGFPPDDIQPQNVERKLYINNRDFVVINSDFFDSLKHDANPYYPEHKKYFFNGTYYRSPIEADLARSYTEQDIPFKYEPEIWLKGLNRPIYTDFVILIRELNQCKFHEHFGLKNSSDYTRKTATTYINYSGAGLLPGLDVFYTYDLDEVPFDIRGFYATLNSVVYNSMFAI